jgi:hypothetical protein
VIAPGDEKLREVILHAAKGLDIYRKPEGKKWSVFYIKKVKFVASEVINEDEVEIKNRVSKVVDSVVADAEKILLAVDAAFLPPGGQLR